MRVSGWVRSQAGPVDVEDRDEDGTGFRSTQRHNVRNEFNEARLQLLKQMVDDLEDDRDRCRRLLFLLREDWTGIPFPLPDEDPAR